MRILTVITLLVTLSIACDNNRKLDIRGNWYTDFGIAGPFDSLSSYGEIYITDSTFLYNTEFAGLLNLHKYYIENDTIYKCPSIKSECEYWSFFKINKLEKDTLWMTINPKYHKPKNGQTHYYVRLPSGEKGYYDYMWNSQNNDSVDNLLSRDFDRRTWKFHCYRLGEMDYYDSLLKSGLWASGIND